MVDSDDLKHALAAHLGATLTPEVASAILMRALEGRDRSISLFQFPVRWMGDQRYIAAAERLSDVLPELHGLHERHFAETERYRAHQGCNPNYDAMKASERAGQMIQFTLRDAITTQMVGNARFYLTRSRHTGALCAQEDTYYVAPDHRKGMLALSFWRYCEECLAKLDVLEIRTDSKLPPGADVSVTDAAGPVSGVHSLNKRMGYRAIAIKFVKTLEGNSDVR